MNKRPRGRPRNKRDLIRISSHIPKDHYRLLSEISEDEDLSIAQTIRRAIELYLVSQQDVLGLEDSDLAIAQHISETRSRKAQLIAHTSKFEKLKEEKYIREEIDLMEESSNIFQELNPEAF